MIRFHVQETTEDTFAIDSQGPLQAAHAVLVRPLLAWWNPLWHHGDPCTHSLTQRPAPSAFD
jgi:hypothetical protein